MCSDMEWIDVWWSVRDNLNWRWDDVEKSNIDYMYNIMQLNMLGDKLKIKEGGDWRIIQVKVIGVIH